MEQWPEWRPSSLRDARGLHHQAGAAARRPTLLENNHQFGVNILTNGIALLTDHFRLRYSQRSLVSSIRQLPEGAGGHSGTGA
ncbi:hypothetical protein E2C01_013004 [Portunus trituberculatus]|uniref:Uncharacterized protein n=1 Tax=Portunus trituberculatus TaxID=210409 RepID=A0A5B7DFN9_PORTR|nr:hypothetical protein [Portunus trituberculatus]